MKTVFVLSFSKSIATHKSPRSAFDTCTQYLVLGLRVLTQHNTFTVYFTFVCCYTEQRVIVCLQQYFTSALGSTHFAKSMCGSVCVAVCASQTDADVLLVEV